MVCHVMNCCQYLTKMKKTKQKQQSDVVVQVPNCYIQ